MFDIQPPTKVIKYQWLYRLRGLAFETSKYHRTEEDFIYSCGKTKPTEFERIDKSAKEFTV